MMYPVNISLEHFEKNDYRGLKVILAETAHGETMLCGHRFVLILAKSIYEYSTALSYAQKCVNRPLIYLVGIDSGEINLGLLPCVSTCLQLLQTISVAWPCVVCSPLLIRQATS